VAGIAGAQNLGVINTGGWLKCNRCVTICTRYGRSNVGRGLAFGCRAVVARAARSDDLGVIHFHSGLEAC
jgi:hypothetical protein